MARKKGGGGKLNRSEIVQARLDPKLHIAAEIMARSERRTLSSFIERSIEQTAKTFKVKRNLFFPWWSENPNLYCRAKIYSKSDIVTVEQAAQDINADHEAVRFLKFASYFPDLLNKHEEEMFSNITFTQYFWMHYPVNTEDEMGNIIHKNWVQVDAIEGLVLGNLLEYWKKIKLNQITYEELCELPKGKKISGPLKEDPRAIKKYVRTNNPQMPYKIIFVRDEKKISKVFQDDLSKSEFWKKYSKNLNTEKIEIIETDQGPRVIATFTPIEKENEQEWVTNFKEKMEA